MTLRIWRNSALLIGSSSSLADVDKLDTLLLALDHADSDKELFDIASQIVTLPKKPGNDISDVSFVLHAPLEICARFFLLPLVDDERAFAAREQIKKTAKRYFALEDNLDNTYPVSSADFDVTKVNVSSWATSLLFASHAVILLCLQKALVQTNDAIESVLWKIAGAIEIESKAKMSFLADKHKPIEEAPELIKNPQEWIFEHVGNIDHVEDIDGVSNSIRGGVDLIQNAGLTVFLTDTIGAISNFSDRADFNHPFKVLLRMATLSMLTEGDQHAKYGWTHCLTIPHAIWSVCDLTESKSTMFQAAVVHVATFRSLLAEQKIEPGELGEYFEEDENSVFAEHYVRMSDIISSACTFEDAHLVKYVYACFDMMKKDPQYSKLYIAAAAKLLEAWSSDPNKSHN